MDTSDDVNTSDDMDTTCLLDDLLEVETKNAEEFTCNLQCLHQSFNSDGWTDVSNSPFSELRLSKISTFPTGSLQRPAITHYLVYSDLTWSVNIHNHPLILSECTEIENIPQYLCPKTLDSLVKQLNRLNICRGQCDPHFVSM